MKLLAFSSRVWGAGRGLAGKGGSLSRGENSSGVVFTLFYVGIISVQDLKLIT